jgi:hypothetical protein
MGGRNSRENITKKKVAMIFFIMGIALLLIGVIMQYRNETTRGKAGGRITSEVEIAGFGVIVTGALLCLYALITRVSKKID